jgi:hypothetical protein
MILPNHLSTARILLTPIFLYLFLSGDHVMMQISLAVFFIAAITDWYDGWLARKFNDEGCYHCDLHVGNILASGPPEGAKLFILDLHRVKLRERLSTAQRLENLAMIWASG